MLREISTFDELTGALNQRGLENVADTVQSNSNRNFEIMSLLLIDVDGLKAINAKHGWQFGDKVLKEFSDVIRDIVRSGDIVGRSGDDEFCVLLFNTAEQHAMSLARRICNSLELKLIELEDQNAYATASIGVSNSEFLELNYHDLLAAAQSAMYNAKELGRNRVIAHSSIRSID